MGDRAPGGDVFTDAAVCLSNPPKEFDPGIGTFRLQDQPDFEKVKQNGGGTSLMTGDLQQFSHSRFWRRASGHFSIVLAEEMLSGLVDFSTRGSPALESSSATSRLLKDAMDR